MNFQTFLAVTKPFTAVSFIASLDTKGCKKETKQQSFKFTTD